MEDKRYEVDTLWVDSILGTSVPIDWQDGSDDPGYTSYEAPDCETCGDYARWSDDAHEWQCVNPDCENVGNEVEDDSEGPMMNYHYPLPDLHRAGSAYAAADAIRDLPLCVVEFSDGSYSLALTGGGMDLSWEICEAFTRLGYLPPFRFARDLPKYAGREESRYLIAACRRTCSVLHDWAEQASERLNEF